ncbi:MAG TPA: site-2 protease family protein [candidate division Zixibacteria bacterium]
MGLEYYLLITPPLFFAFTVHEYAHAWAAYKKGDNTAKLAGRLTLNPLAHIDILGTILLYLYGFGWAKPVPVNPYNFRNPRKDDMLVSFAGPVSNLFSAFIYGITFRIFTGYSMGSGSEASLGNVLFTMVVFGLRLNIILAFFNLIPISPLDGSHILMGLVPLKYTPWVARLQRIGPFFLLGIVLMDYVLGTRILWGFFGPFIAFFGTLFAGPQFIRSM